MRNTCQCEWFRRMLTTLQAFMITKAQLIEGELWRKKVADQISLMARLVASGSRRLRMIKRILLALAFQTQRFTWVQAGWMTWQFKPSKVCKKVVKSSSLEGLTNESKNCHLRRKKPKSNKFYLLIALVKVTGECIPQIELIAGR